MRSSARLGHDIAVGVHRARGEFETVKVEPPGVDLGVLLDDGAAVEPAVGALSPNSALAQTERIYTGLLGIRPRRALYKSADRPEKMKGGTASGDSGSAS